MSPTRPYSALQHRLTLLAHAAECAAGAKAWTALQQLMAQVLNVINTYRVCSAAGEGKNPSQAGEVRTRSLNAYQLVGCADALTVMAESVIAMLEARRAEKVDGPHSSAPSSSASILEVVSSDLLPSFDENTWLVPVRSLDARALGAFFTLTIEALLYRRSFTSLIELARRFVAASGEAVEALTLLRVVRVAQRHLSRAREHYWRQQRDAVQRLDDDYQVCEESL